MADVKLNNEEYEVIDAPEIVTGGDSNKLKLQVATNTAIRSVQMSFLSEKKNSVKASLTSVNNAFVKENDAEIKKQLEDKLHDLSFAVDVIEKAYAEAIGLYKKAFVYGVKILKLPEDKFTELATKSEVTITNDANEQDVITTTAFQEADKAVSEAIDNADSYFQDELLKKHDLVFDEIDSRAVQDAVNQNMGSLDNINSELPKVINDAKQTYDDNVSKSDISDIYDQVINGILGEDIDKHTEDNQISSVQEIKIETDDEKSLQDGDELEDIKKLIEEAKARRDALEKENDDAKEALRLANEARETALREKEEAEQAREEAKTKAERYSEQVNVYIEELKSLNEANAQLANSASEARNLADQVSDEVSKTAEVTAEIRKETEGYEASSSASVNALREFRASLLGENQDSVEIKGPVK